MRSSKGSSSAATPLERKPPTSIWQDGTPTRTSSGSRGSDERYANNLLGQEDPRERLLLEHLRSAGCRRDRRQRDGFHREPRREACVALDRSLPAIEGVFRKPTVVNNIETMACVPHIVNRGADWFKSMGVPADLE